MILNLNQFYIEVEEELQVDNKVLFKPLHHVLYIGEDTKSYERYITDEMHEDYSRLLEKIKNTIMNSQGVSKQVFNFNGEEKIALTINPENKQVISINFVVTTVNIMDLPMIENFMTYLTKKLVLNNEVTEAKTELFLIAPSLLLPEVEGIEY